MTPLGRLPRFRIAWRLPGVTRPTVQDRTLGAQLARAFHHDAVFSYVEPGPARRAQTLPWLFTRLVMTCKDARIARVPGEATLLWMPAPHSDLTLGRLLRARLWLTPAHLGWRATIRLLASLFSAAGAAPEAHDPEAWYIFILGVDPEHQGKRLGPHLVTAVAEQADAAGAPLRLETSSPRNVRMYEKLGFEVVDARAAYGTPMQWFMVRRPR